MIKIVASSELLDLDWNEIIVVFCLPWTLL